MKEVAQFIQTSLQIGNHSLTAADLARSFAMSESKLRHDFKAFYGIPVRAFIIRQRMERAKSLLEKKEYSVKEIAVMAGYDELSNFSRDFKMYTGIAPRRYKKISHVQVIC